MSAGDALQLYTVLTIGDGLIAQIPALLISVTCGMIITRVPNGDPNVEANIGREIAEQITSQPKAWIISAVAMLGFAALPGMPTGVFITIAVICGGGGILQLQRAKPKAPQEAPVNVAPEDNGREDLRTFTPSRQFLLQFHPQQNKEQIRALVSEIRQKRNRLVVQYGLTLPSFIIETAAHLELDEFRFSVYEVPMVKATFTRTHVAIDVSTLEDAEFEFALPGGADRQEAQWLWMPVDAAELQDGALESVSANTLIIERMERALQACGPQFIGLQESKAILGWLETEQPELAQEMQRVLPLSRFSAVLQRLASECVPLRAIRVIAETLIEYGQHEREITVLADYVRIALKSVIYHQYCGTDGLLVWLMTPESEGILRDSLRQTQTETFFALSNESGVQLVQQLRIAFPLRSAERAVLLVAQDLRSPLRSLLQEEFHHVPVLSFAEISNAAQVKVLGRFDLEDELQPLGNEYAA
jgi:type III secretion protein V